MTFNILQGGGEAANVGFPNAAFGGSRIDELASVIHLADADIVGVQENCRDDRLLVALGPHWSRVGSIYSTRPLEPVETSAFLTVARLKLANGRRVTIVNCHWFPPRGGYGPDIVQAEMRKSSPIDSDIVAKNARENCAIPNGPRGYNATLKPIRDSIANGDHVILTGDFNEPSHLDWTKTYSQSGRDRWVRNPTEMPLRFAIDWPGSKALADLGLVDAWRAVYPDEVQRPGNTWTPPYPTSTPGRRDYGDQCLDRIDRIYYFGSTITTVSAAVVGEHRDTADIVFPSQWPSDHRAVVAEFGFAE
ncbi:MAG: endonuclease/exonuclease/phosphatase family protein [Planctomycetaceae bacterium]|nr:endonuclease/exonuclease/phosphatase family protein [Planctomycetaceae bacterium]